MLFAGNNGLESTVAKLLSRADAALKDKVQALHVHECVHAQRACEHICKFGARTYLWLYGTSIASQKTSSGPISHSTRHVRSPSFAEDGRSYCCRQKYRKHFFYTRGRLFVGCLQEQGAGGGQERQQQGTAEGAVEAAAVTFENVNVLKEKKRKSTW